MTETTKTNDQAIKMACEIQVESDRKAQTTEQKIKNSLNFLENMRDFNKEWRPTHDAYQTCIELIEELNAKLYS